MSDLNTYLLDADADTVTLLRHQWSDAVERRVVQCPCGLIRALELAFRCLYCGVYFCASCAEKHFGETRREWRERHRKGPPDGRTCPVCDGDTYDCRGCGQY